MFPSAPNDPQPRSFADLQAERAYLLNVLQGENDRATNLLRRVPPLEETLGLTQESSIRRSAKKQLGWLKHQIKETIGQEKAILSQLGQISHEIQLRERWSQIEHERQQHLQALNNLNIQTIFDGGQPIQFNPLSPEFQPQEMSFSQWISQSPQPQYWNPTIYEFSGNPVRDYYANKAIAPLTVETNGPGLKMKRPGLLHRRSSMNNEDPECFSTSTGRSSPPPRCQSNPETPSDMWVENIRGTLGETGRGEIEYFDLPIGKC